MTDQGTLEVGAVAQDLLGPAGSDADDRVAFAVIHNYASRSGSPTLRRISGAEDMSSLRVVNVSPEIEKQRQRLEHNDSLDSSPIATDIQQDSGGPMSSLASPLPGSVFSIAEEPPEEPYTEATTTFDGADAYGRESGDEDSYNLKPPPPKDRSLQNDLEALSDRFFSADHVDLILKDYALASRFKTFLESYVPHHVATLRQYAELKKAIAALEFANAVANRIQSPMGHPPFAAANIDERFEAQAKQTARNVVEEALPAYLTHRLVALVTDTLVKEITGNSAPIMHELIPSLAEVYCISDPSVKDNPIVYASEEFFNITQYSKEYTIGRNCRFLQGERSSDASVKRLIRSLSRGEECCETILNYRRDGTPFMNLLMIAPLYDNKGAVRYFLGAQIDVSSLIEGGRGLESFAQLLAEDRRQTSSRGYGVYKEETRDPKAVLGDLGQLLTEEESEIVKNRATMNAAGLDQDSVAGSIRGGTPSRQGTRSSRIVLGMDAPPEKPMWPSMELGRSGRLPGVYQNYLLVRPFPSLRITFTSPSLRIPGLLQTKLLDRIGGSPSVREGLQDALARGTGVTAKVTWLTSGHNAEIEAGKTRWLHCTPLIGSDERVGVWMIVICDDERARGSLRRDDDSSKSLTASRGAARFTSQKLYADYLRMESKEDGRPSSRGTTSTRDMAVADQFRDF